MDPNGASSFTSKYNLRLALPAVVCISVNNTLTALVMFARVSLYSGLISTSISTPSSLVRMNDTGKDVFATFGTVGELLGAIDGTLEGIFDGWNEGKLVGPTEGICDGLLDGGNEGCAEGRSEGVVEGFADGDKEGCAEGRSEGVVEGCTVGDIDGENDGSVDGLIEGVVEGTGGVVGLFDGDTVGVVPLGFFEGLNDGLLEGAIDGSFEGVFEGADECVSDG